MTTNRYPKVNTIISNDLTPGSVPAHKVLIIGQSNSANITSGELETEIGNNTSTIKTKFGADQNLTAGILAFRKINTFTRLDAIALNDNGSGVDATGAIAITGPATENGTLYFSIDSEKNNKVQVAITSGDNATEIGDAIETAINALDVMPVTAVNTIGTIALTSKNAGTIGNDIGIKVSGSVAGVSVTLTAMSSGATDPVLTNLLDVIEGVRYDTIIAPKYIASTIITELDLRYNPTNNVLDGILIHGMTDAASNIGTYADTLSTRSAVLIGNKLLATSTIKGGAFLENPFVMSSMLGVIRSLRLTNNSYLGRYSIGGLTKGGIATNGYPYANTLLVNLSLAPEGQNFTSAEITTLEGKNVSVLTNDQDGSYANLNAVFVTAGTSIDNRRITREETIRAIRETIFYRFKKRYKQHKMVADGQEKPNLNLVSPKSFVSDSMEDWQYFVDNFLIRTETADGENTLTIWKTNLENTLVFNYLEGSITADFLAHIATELAEITENIIRTFE